MNARIAATQAPSRERTAPTDRELLHRARAARVYDVAIESALQPATLLSTRVGRPVLLKRED